MPSRERQSSNRSVLIALFALIGLLIVADSLVREQKLERVSVTIIDPLSTDSEAELTSSCVELLRSAGYDVDVIGGPEVSVDRLKSIPSGCSALVMRVHSGVFEDSVWLFTGERYDSTRHVMEQLANEVHIARAARGIDLFFAVGSSFVRRFMKEETSGLKRVKNLLPYTSPRHRSFKDVRAASVRVSRGCSRLGRRAWRPGLPPR